MTPYAFHTLDVFTDRIFGGNPLAVFPDGADLETAQLQAIAREFNLSETVFVLPAEQPDHAGRLRIFTPGTELPFAGHPTIGTAHLLAAIGKIPLEGPETQIVLEEGVGPVAVTIRASDGRPNFVQLSPARMPEFGPTPPSTDDLADVLSLVKTDITHEPPPAAVSCGVPFLFVMLRTLDALARAQIRHATWQKILAAYWAPQLYLLAPENSESKTGYRARMFAPAMGIAEDPATGAAASALPGYLAPSPGKARGTYCWTVRQGVEMRRPSRLDVEADLSDGKVIAVRVGGRSVLVSHGEMQVPASI